MVWYKCVLENIENWERFRKQLDVFLFRTQFDGVSVSTFGYHDCAFEFFLFHDFVESVHGGNATVASPSMHQTIAFSCPAGYQ